MWNPFSYAADKFSDAYGYLKDKAGDAKDAVVGAGSTPNNYDAEGKYKDSQWRADEVYNLAVGDAQNAIFNPAPAGALKAQTIAPNSPIVAQRINAPSQVVARDIATPDTLSGAAATELRAQQLAQAKTAAESPSSAAAQMKAAQTQIARQQMGQAAMARGAERATARRDAMLATGTRGMEAAQTTAALAAQENMAKQNAYTAALGNVRTGDVYGAQAQTQIGAANLQGQIAAQTATGNQYLTAAQANQASDIQAQAATGQQRLTAMQANQQADLAAQTGTAQNALSAYKTSSDVRNQAYGSAINAVGAQNQAQAVASNYATGLNTGQAATRDAWIGAGAKVAGAYAMSDENAKTDIASIGGSGKLTKGYFAALADAYGIRSPYSTDAQPDPSALDIGTLSDERAKQDIHEGGEKGLIDFAERVPLATFRYREGLEDGGAYAHVGTTAQGVEEAGPYGKMVVKEGPDGYKRVDLATLAHIEAKAALAKAGKKGRRANG